MLALWMFCRSASFRPRSPVLTSQMRNGKAKSRGEEERLGGSGVILQLFDLFFRETVGPQTGRVIWLGCFAAQCRTPTPFAVQLFADPIILKLTSNNERFSRRHNPGCNISLNAGFVEISDPVQNFVKLFGGEDGGLGPSCAFQLNMFRKALYCPSRSDWSFPCKFHE